MRIQPGLQSTSTLKKTSLYPLSPKYQSKPSLKHHQFDISSSSPAPKAKIPSSALRNSHDPLQLCRSFSLSKHYQFKQMQTNSSSAIYLESRFIEIDKEDVNSPISYGALRSKSIKSFFRPALDFNSPKSKMRLPNLASKVSIPELDGTEDQYCYL